MVECAALVSSQRDVNAKRQPQPAVRAEQDRGGVSVCARLDTYHVFPAWFGFFRVLLQVLQDGVPYPPGKERANCFFGMMQEVNCWAFRTLEHDARVGGADLGPDVSIRHRTHQSCHRAGCCFVPLIWGCG